jgi:antitoxin (DNA-binding transcriptional repressor) of toxin-antitoxin stability system
MVARIPYKPSPTRLSQRDLRSDISHVLHMAEAGKRFEITVDGRVVAELGPPSGRPRGTDWRTAHEFIHRARERHKSVVIALKQ